MAVYTQRHQIEDALGKVTTERIQTMIADCIAGEQARAAENEDGEFDQAGFDEWLNQAVGRAREARYRAEADNIDRKERRGEVPEGSWAAAVAQIREELPYPE